MIFFAEIVKTFGAHGELIIKLRDEAPEEIDVNDPVFIVMDGLPAPFYFKSFGPRGGNRVQVVFEDFETQKSAEELVGKKIEIKGHEASVDNQPPGIDRYKVVDKTHGEIGVVTGFLDIPGNPCLQVEHNGREIIIPFHDDIVTKTDHKKHVLHVELPHGLLKL